jgi:membrane protein YqaA with SNARE-associated domain
MDVTDTTERPRLLQRLYDWMIRNSQGKQAFWALGAVSFAESSLFPIPPDVMLVPMVLADRKRAFLLATWCTVTSVLGGIAGYMIGALLYESVGRWLIEFYGYGQEIETFRAAYAEWGAWIILIKGLTPIPYKLVTIASGLAGYNFLAFVVLSAITRGLRFFLVVGLLYIFGTPIRRFIEKRLGVMLLLVLASMVLGFVVAHYLF